MEEISQIETAIQEHDGLKEKIDRAIREKDEILMLKDAQMAKALNLELEVRQLTESLKISRNEESLMRAKLLKLEESIEEMEKRDSFCRVLEKKQRELDEANRARYELQGELGRVRNVVDELNLSFREFKDTNEQLLSQVACMVKKIDLFDSELGMMRSDRGKEHDELNKVARNKRSNPTEEEESSLRKKGKFEQSHVQEENGLELESDRRPKEDNCSPLSSDASSDLVIIHYRVAVFHDFDKDRREDCFAANQIWATYEGTDFLPRAYVLVRKVASPFKLKITWLVPDPDDEGEMDWCDADLPIASGKFILGDSKNVTNPVMFSHQIQCMKSGEDSYLIYPKKGETWAVFRDWDIKWSSDPEGHLTDEFEYVEILSDFTQNVGIEVAYLAKVEGFVSLFQKAKKNGVNMFCVLPNELYRFSHQIPSYKMTGNERKGVPSGWFEFDTAALPTYLVRVDSGYAERYPQSRKHHQRDRI